MANRSCRRWLWLLGIIAALPIACDRQPPTTDDDRPLFTVAEQQALEDDSKAPPVAVLNKVLEAIVDPTISAADKVDLLEDSDRDRDVFAKIDHQGTVTYRFIPPVTLDESTKSANANVEVNRPPTLPYTAGVPIVFKDDTWRIGKAVICPLLVDDSPMCPPRP